MAFWVQLGLQRTLAKEWVLSYLLEVLVTDDKLPLMRVLELMCLNILPQCLNDHWTGLGVDAQEPSQARI